MSDVLGIEPSGLDAAMAQIEAAGQGVLVLIRNQETPAHEKSRLPEYGIGSHILADLGVRDMDVLTTHPAAVAESAKGLESYGLRIVSFRDIS
jgi:3,4-dihydroxy 2-butanone 4-phosphate synthase / GTP cyclohydrolase II